MRRGHGPAVYGYGWGWFVLCLRLAGEEEKAAAKTRRLERLGQALDMAMALRADGKELQDYFDKLERE